MLLVICLKVCKVTNINGLLQKDLPFKAPFLQVSEVQSASQLTDEPRIIEK